MHTPFPSWPVDYLGNELKEFRAKALDAPIAVDPGCCTQASRNLLNLMLPGTRQDTAEKAHPQRWPWVRPAFSDGALAVRVANLVARGADPSVRYTAVQGHFSALGITVWLGLEQTANALLEAGARPTWPTPDGYVFSEEEDRALLGDETSSYRGVPLDPLGAIAQGLGVAVSLEYKEEELEAALRIAHRLGQIASPFRSDPGTGRNPIEELFNQIDYHGAPLTPATSGLSSLVWSWVQARLCDDQIESLALQDTEDLFLPGVSDRVPPAMTDALKARILEDHLERRIAKASSPMAPSAPKRPSARF